MDLTLKNIGLIEKSTFKVEGLTVLTGENNCGKTTVGKTLYCLLETFYNCENKYKSARRSYICDKAKEIMSVFFGTPFFNSSRARHLSYREFLTEICRKINDDSSMYDIESYVNRISERVFLEKVYGQESGESVDPKRHEFYLQWVERANAICQMANKVLCSENAFDNYIEDTLNVYLGMVFNSQVKSIRYNKQIAEINFDSYDFGIKLKTNTGNHFKLIENESKSLMSKKCIFIDNPYIVDELESFDDRYMHSAYRFDSDNSVGVASGNRYLLPAQNLLHKISFRNKGGNYFQDKENDLKLNNIIQLVNNIVPGEFSSNDRGIFYVSGKTKLNISNLATGSKMFSIIKMLIINGEIDKDTVLILDEPEAHLHPDWINKLAEILVVLSKEIGVQILLTTHSPNFLMAIEAYTKKYDFQGKTHFYHAKMRDDNYRVMYEEQIDCRSIAYASFTNPLIEVKTIKDE